MAHSSASDSPSQDDLYVSDIITGAHGDKYQKDLALVIFERATIKNYEFRLGYEMAIADKFDDVAFFNKTNQQWTLIQTKHADTSKGKPPPLKFDSLFPLDDGTREKGDFSLFKYLKSYMAVQANIKERKNIVIFTNKAFTQESLEQSVEVESRQVEEVLRFGNSSHLGLKVKSPLIKEMLDYVNRDFNLLRDSIAKLFREEIVEQVLKNFKTPVGSILYKTNNSVKFAETPSPEANQLIASLTELIDVQTAQVPLAKCKDLFAGKSRIKTLPLCANDATVLQFFEDLVLSVAQPDDLRDEIDRDLRTWMRTWIRPDYLSRLEESQLSMAAVSIEHFFNARQSQVRIVADDRSFKKFLDLSDGEEFFDKVRGDFEQQISNLSNPSTNDAHDYYISRRIELNELSNNNSYSEKDRTAKIRMQDDTFVDELSGKLGKQRFLLLTAEPGMGKSTILEYIALEAQRKSGDSVHLFYLNTFHQKLTQIKTTDNFEELLSVLMPFRTKSKQQLNSVLGSESKHLLVFDALDEVYPQNRSKVLEILRQILKTPNAQVLVSARRNIQSLVENEFKVKAMDLVPFNEHDQINFLRKFWKVPPVNISSFREYVAHLFKVFHSDINRAVCEFTGLPLMLKMLAEVYSDHFQEFLTSLQQALELSKLQETLSTIGLYEQFVRKCFDNRMIKKHGSSYIDIDEDNKLLFDQFVLEHQLLAIKYLQIDILQIIVKREKHAKVVNAFEKRITTGTERSPLVEAAESDIRFIHRSYAEFLAAKFLYCYIEKYEAEIFGLNSDANLFAEHPLIRVFFFTMVEEQFKTETLNILRKHYEKNSDIALWACEVYGQKTVKFLLRSKCDSTTVAKLLYVAAEHNCYNICTDLFENHQVIVDYRVKGWTSLQMAAKQGHMDIVELLVAHSVNVNTKDEHGWTSLHYAAHNGHLEVVKLLIDNCADINATENIDRTPLHLACESGHTTVVTLLIDHSENVNAKDAKGWTPLHLAVQNDQLQVVTILIDITGDVDTKDHYGLTPLHQASREGHSDVVKLLIDRFRDVNSKNKDGLTPLHYAAQNGRLEVAKILLENSADINATEADGWTPLHCAADKNQSEVVALLIDNFADVNVKEVDDWTPLHLAAQNGHSKVITILLDNSADIDAKHKQHWTPLHLAAQNGHSEVVRILLENVADINAKEVDEWTHSKVVKILLDYSADINAKENAGLTPLHCAAPNNQSEVVAILIDNSADINATHNTEWTPLHQAAANGHLEVGKLLLDNSADVNVKEVDDWTPLHLAAHNGHAEVVKILLNNSADINAKEIYGYTPLHCAARKNQSEVVTILIDNFADIDAIQNTYWTPLHQAAVRGHSAVVKILLDNSANINATQINGWTPLHCAAKNNQLEVVALLIDYFADINAKHKQHWTPLHQAAAKGHAEVVKVLLDNSADINVKEVDEWTPLHLAAQNGHSDVATVLLDYSADINARTNEYWTPLHIAAENNREEVVKILINRLADVNANARYDRTPLHLASQNGHSSVVKLLLDHCGDINARNNKGWTPLHYAAQKGHEDVVRLLIEHSAEIGAQDVVGWTPLDDATWFDHTNVIKILNGTSNQ